MGFVCLLYLELFCFDLKVALKGVVFFPLFVVPIKGVEYMLIDT
jgi:hypothetical protein